MPFGVGFGELVIIIIVAVVLFGGRLPEVARTLGQTYQQFRKGLNEIQSTFQFDIDAEPAKPKQPSQSYRDYDIDSDPPPNTKFLPPPQSED